MFYHPWIPAKAGIQGNNLTHENLQTFTKDFLWKTNLSFIIKSAFDKIVPDNKGVRKSPNFLCSKSGVE